LHTVAANAYIAYRSLRGRLTDTISPPELDPLCALIVRLVWLNGWSQVADDIRAEFAVPRSTLSSALGRLENRGYIRRHPNPSDGRYVVVTLTQSGRRVAPAVTELINELERDVHDAAGDDAPKGFDRVATMLAAMDEEED
jgi:DNA-binding MarR family transcriptional regulator